jgi:hypothetical protein
MFWDQSKPAAPRAADEWFTPRRFAGLLGALVCLMYPDVVFGWGTFFHRDYAVFGYPLAAYHRESFWRGEVPLWNPFNYCGLPFLAQWNTMALYPLSLFYLLLPLSWSLGVFCLGHLFLGGMGMYLLARRWTNNPFAGAVAGVAFPFTALMLHCLMWPNNITALGWLPWVVLVSERAWREGGRQILLAALVGTMQMLAGAPEVILLTWVLLAALFAGELVLAPGRRWIVARRFLAAGLWVATLAAAQLLPFLDLLAHSQRDKGFADSVWAMPVWGWANLVVPLFRSYHTTLGVYAQPDQYWVPSYYLGVGILAIALLAAVRARRPRVFLLGAITVFCLVLALGKNGFVYPVLKQVLPGLGFMRYPVKFVILPAVLVPLLAALAITPCLSSSPMDWPRERRRIVVLGIALVAIIGFVSWSAFQYPLKGTSASVAAVSAASRAAFLAAILGGLAALRRVQQPRWATALRFGFLLCLWLDALTAGPRPNPTAPRWVYDQNLARKELNLQPPPTIGEARAMLNAEAEGNMNVALLTNAADQVLYCRLALFGDANLLDDIPKVAGMYSLYFRELGEVFAGLWATPLPPAGLADFLAVSHINVPGKATYLAPRPTHLPWITAGQKAVLAGRDEILSGLVKPDFDPRQTVFLPAEVRGLITTTNPSPAKVSGQRFSAHKVEFDIEAREPALAVISQSYYHNWRAYIGGSPARSLRANHAFQAVEVPAGRSHVRLVYEDRAFHFGALVSLIAALVWITAWFRLRKQRVVEGS